jgi:hypothetical protein
MPVISFRVGCLFPNGVADNLSQLTEKFSVKISEKKIRAMKWEYITSRD